MTQTTSSISFHGKIKPNFSVYLKVMTVYLTELIICLLRMVFVYKYHVIPERDLCFPTNKHIRRQTNN